MLHKVESTMKLSIRSDVGKSLQEILQRGDIDSGYCFRVGYKTRDGFVPYLNAIQRDRVKKGLLLRDSSLVMSRRELMPFQFLCEVGYVSGHWLVLGSQGRGSPLRVPYLHCDTYGVYFTETYIQLEICGKPDSLSALFQPVKEIYKLLGPTLLPGKPSETKPTAAPKFLKMAPMGSSVIMAVPGGEWATLIITGGTAQLVFKRGETFIINSGSPVASLGDELQGYWHRGEFTVCNASILNGKDVTGRNLSHRLALAKRTVLGIPFCRVNKMYTASVRNRTALLERHGALLYAPPKGDQFFLYSAAHKISFFFKVLPKTVSGLPLFQLLQGEPSRFFRGTDAFPYSEDSPLSREDRDFIAKFPPHSVFEFRWENDNLVPYAHKMEHHLHNTNCENWDILHRTHQDLFKNTEATPKAPMMANQRKPLKMLPVNKSVVFYSPVEGEDVLVQDGYYR